MRIIALKGSGNTGKSTTICMLPTLLAANGYNQVPGLYRSFGGDIIDVFENGIQRVGITSAGDNFDAVHDRLADLIAANCNVCVCACRNYDADRGNGRNGTHAAIHGFNATVQFVPKTVVGNPAQENAANTADAGKLVTLI